MCNYRRNVAAEGPGAASGQKDTVFLRCYAALHDTDDLCVGLDQPFFEEARAVPVRFFPAVDTAKYFCSDGDEECLRTFGWGSVLDGDSLGGTSDSSVTSGESAFSPSAPPPRCDAWVHSFGEAFLSQLLALAGSGQLPPTQQVVKTLC